MVPPPFTRANRHSALLEVHEALDDRKSEAGARFLGGVERLEDAVHHVGRNARPSVSHGNVTGAADGSGGHGHFLAACLAGIQEEIEKRRPKHLGVCSHDQRLWCEPDRSTRSACCHRTRDGIMNGGRDVDRLQHGISRLREAQKLPAQGSRLVAERASPDRLRSLRYLPRMRVDARNAPHCSRRIRFIRVELRMTFPNRSFLT
jgi:hypothetical protein